MDVAIGEAKNIIQDSRDDSKAIQIYGIYVRSGHKDAGKGDKYPRESHQDVWRGSYPNISVFYRAKSIRQST